MTEIHFCDVCNESIPLAAVDTGEAMETGGRRICPDCIPTVERLATGRSHGLGVWVWVLLVLALALAAAALYYARSSVRDLASHVDAIQRDSKNLDTRHREELSRLALAVDQVRGEMRHELGRLADKVNQGDADLRAELTASADRIAALESAVAGHERVVQRVGVLDANMAALSERLRGEHATQELMRDDLLTLSSQVEDLEREAEQRRAAAAAEDQFSKHVAELLRDLQDANEEVRYKALEELFKMPDERLLPHIYPLLADPYEFNRFYAAHLLGEWKSRPAVGYLIDVLSDEVSFVRDAAAQALRRITSENFGFDHNAPLDDREAAVKQWQTWWAANKKAFLK